MKIYNTPLQGAFVLEPEKFEDERGYFFESFNQQTFCDISGVSVDFVQDNQAYSYKNVVRGLHFQNPPYAQSKLIRAVDGDIFDVIVDLRKKSSTYGHWYGIELTGANHLQLFVPKGFAHGYSVISEGGATVAYKCNEYYHPEAESGIHILDEALGIDWRIPENDMVISGKDRNWQKFSQLDSKF